MKAKTVFLLEVLISLNLCLKLRKLQVTAHSIRRRNCEFNISKIIIYGFYYQYLVFMLNLILYIALTIRRLHSPG